MPDTRTPAAYARARLQLSLTSGAVELGLLAVFLLSGLSAALAHRLPAPPAWTVLLYTAAVGLGLQLVLLPLGWWGRRIEIRFGMNRQSAASWWADEGKGLLLGGGLALAAAELVYALLRAAPGSWWLWAWAAFTAFSVILAQLAPVLLLPLFYKLRPLSADDEQSGVLVRRLLETCDRLRQTDPRLPRLHGIFEWKLGQKSAKANAALTGLGRTRRVILSDTLLADSSAEEIEAVFAHELGHHVHGDIWSGIAFQAGLSLLGFWLAGLALARWSVSLGLHGVGDVGGLPLLILVFSVLGLLLLPVRNAFVRRMERRADDYSFQALGSAEPLIAGLERLAQKNLAEVEPPRWKEWLLYSHPSIATRVRRGRAWEAAHRGTAQSR